MTSLDSSLSPLLMPTTHLQTRIISALVCIDWSFSLWGRSITVIYSVERNMINLYIMRVIFLDS